MLFQIDDSIRVLAESDGAPDYLVDFTEELFRARRAGRHIVFAKNSTLDALAGLPGLSAKTKQTIKSVKDRIRSKKSFFDDVMVFVRVVAESGVKRRINENGKYVIEASADILSNDLVFRETYLLVENYSDGEFYKAITLIYNNYFAPSQSVRINLSIFPGGGSQTPRHYNILKSEPRLTFCIIDGDYEFMGAAPGSNTAGPILNSDFIAPSAFADALIIDCYSIENLIPPALLRIVLNLGDSDASWLSNLENLSPKDFWLYLPLKRGKNCSAFKGVGPKEVYWRSNKGSFMPKHPVCEGWETQVECAETCVVLDCISGKTLEKVVNYLKEMESKATFSELDTIVEGLPLPVFKMWEQVARGVTSWCCSGQRMAVA